MRATHPLSSPTFLPQFPHAPANESGQQPYDFSPIAIPPLIHLGSSVEVFDSHAERWKVHKWMTAEVGRPVADAALVFQH